MTRVRLIREDGGVAIWVSSKGRTCSVLFPTDGQTGKALASPVGEVIALELEHVLRQLFDKDAAP